MRLALFGLTPLLIATAALAADKPAPRAPANLPDGDKVICKRQLETGSLVKGRKTCFTRNQWRDQMLNAQAETARLQYSNGNPSSQ